MVKISDNTDSNIIASQIKLFETTQQVFGIQNNIKSSNLNTISINNSSSEVEDKVNKLIGEQLGIEIGARLELKSAKTGIDPSIGGSAVGLPKDPSFDTVSVANKAYIRKDLIVTGHSYLWDTVNVYSTLNVSGTANLNNIAVSAIDVSGNTSLQGPVSASLGLNVGGNATIIGNIYGPSLDNITAGGTLNIGSTNASIVNLGNGSGVQTINIGKNGGGITTINIGGIGDIVNIAGSVNNIITTDLVIEDKYISLNKGAIGSGTARGAGFQIRDDNDNNKGFFMVNEQGTGFRFKPPEDSRNVNFDFKNFENGFIKCSGNTVYGSSAMDTEMTFVPNVTMFSRLNVSGPTIFESPFTSLSTVNIKGAVTAVSTLNVSGKTTLLGPMTAMSSLNVSGDSTLLGPMTAMSSLNVSGKTSLLGAVTAESTLNVSGDSTLLGSLTAVSTLNVSGKSTLLGAVTAVSTLNISGKTTLLGPMTAMSSLNVSGDSTLLGPTTAVSSLNVSGDSTLLGSTTAVSTLNVSGKTTLLGAVTAVSTLNVSGNSTLLGSITAVSTLNVSGNTILQGPTTNSSTVDIVGNTTIKSNLNISGNSTLNGPTTAVSSLNVSGDSTLLGPTTAVSTLNVSGKTTLLGAVTAVSTLNVSGNTVIRGSLIVTGNTILNGWNVKDIIAGSNVSIQNISGNYTISASGTGVNGGGTSSTTLGFDAPTFLLSLLGSAINGSQINEYFGQKVSISSDGTVIAVGLTNTGSAKIYAWNGTSWIQRGATFS